MKAKNFDFALLAVSALLIFGLACRSLTSTGQGSPGAPGTSNTFASNTAGTNTQNGPTTKSVEYPGLEKADFTTTAEDLDREFTRDGVTDKDLEKYESKNIAVSGRVAMLVTEKKGTVQPWVTINAPGIGHGVSCYFDDDRVDQMKLLKKDKMATVQGFQNDFIVPKVSPSLKHCAVLSVD